MLEFLILICSIAVISVHNPVHSILFLILVFLNTAILLLSLGIDFLAIFIIIVYVGAIAILFLFVVMMLNIKLSDFDFHLLRYLPISFFFGLLFLFSLGSPLFLSSSSFLDWFNLLSFFHNNLVNLGILLFTHFFPYLFIGTLILLVAMFGVIILTFSQSSHNKYQSVYLQNSAFLHHHLFK
jgi:NADH-quinone oxidoreductase subunit J